MSDIAEIIRRFRSGQIEQQDVIAEFNTLLKNGHVESDEIIEAIGEEHKVEPLPAGLHDAIIDRIASHLTGQFWAEEPTDGLPADILDEDGSPGSDRVAERLAAAASSQSTPEFVVPPLSDDGDDPDETLSSLPADSVPGTPRSVKLRALIGIGAVVVFLAVAALLLQSGVFRSKAPDVQATESFRPGDSVQDCKSCPPLVVVPAGRIGYSFAVGIYEVTVGEFAAFVEDTGRTISGCNTYDGDWTFYPELGWRDPGFRQSSRHPVTCISWLDARQYLDWISAKTNRSYRLLSAAEWEYVASPPVAGKTGRTLCDRANIADLTAAERYPGWAVSDCTDNFVTTAPGGSYYPNEWGLHDIWGNVYEWVADCWSPDGEAAEAAAVCSARELKGGSWFSREEYVRAGARNHFAPDYRSSSFGFRVARAINE